MLLMFIFQLKKWSMRKNIIINNGVHKQEYIYWSKRSSHWRVILVNRFLILSCETSPCPKSKTTHLTDYKNELSYNHFHWQELLLSWKWQDLLSDQFNSHENVKVFWQKLKVSVSDTCTCTSKIYLTLET